MSTAAASFQEAVRQLALNAGYDLAGFSSLLIDPSDQANLARFANEGYAAGMDWFARHLDLRQDPARLFDGAKSALVLATYYRDQACEDLLADAPIKISRYAVGRDYHRLLRKRGARLLGEIQKLWPECMHTGEGDSSVPGDPAQPDTIGGRVVVDSAPVPEKILARMAGLGWQGKHTNLIHPELGSYFFLSVILLDVDLPGDEPVTDLCGSCRLCLDACPTGALFDDYRIDAGRCISYLTIERDEETPIADAYAAAVSHPATGNAGSKSGDRSASGRPSPDPDFQNWIFGCDICQEVCPYNRNRRSRDRQTAEPAFELRPGMRDFLSHPHPAEAFAEISSGSPLARAGHAKLQQNIGHVRSAAPGTPDAPAEKERDS